MRKKSQNSLIEKYRIALENAEKNIKIADAMKELGFDDQNLSNGKSLWEETRKLLMLKDDQRIEQTLAYNKYQKAWEAMERLYISHRKKAKLVFRKDPNVQEALMLHGEIPESYHNWIRLVEYFYRALNENPEWRKRLETLKVTPEELETAQTLLKDLLEARRHYEDERGESQEATRLKDAAFDKLDDWMSVFYATARIALEDQPELQESLMRKV